MTTKYGEYVDGYRAERGASWATLYDALREYRMSNMVHTDGDHYPLVDLLTPDGSAIDAGEEEMIWLTDELFAAAEKASFQARVDPWLIACFGEEIARDPLERGDRLLEEVLELLQSGGYPFNRIPLIADYVDGRPAGEPAQEAGGVMNTMAAYCLAHGLNMHTAGEVELARVWTMVEKIRAKQKTKPKGSPLPVPVQHVAPGRPESVQAFFEVYGGQPDTGPHATALMRYIEELEAQLAKRADMGEALMEVKDAILRADPDVLTDTLWMPEDVLKGATVVDRIDIALAPVQTSSGEAE